MADEYVNNCTLECNGQSITDFKSYTENEQEVRRPVNLMNKTGYSSVTPRSGFSVVYAVPASGSEFDFKAVQNGTFVAEYKGGRRVRYSGVNTLKIGQSTIDGDQEMTRQIDFMADDRKEE